jgi:F0F1-type ATP synthase delta subunit
MQREYTKAFLALIENGVTVDDALRGLRAVLEQARHEKLLGSILREALRELSGKTRANVVRLSLATEATESSAAAEIAVALRALGSSDTTPRFVEVDETLVGGFVATFNHQEYDQSYKRVLRSLYESITV